MAGFDDWVPGGAKPPAAAQPSSLLSRMGEMFSSDVPPATALVKQYGHLPEVQNMLALERGNLADELTQVLPVKIREGFHGSLLGSTMDYADSGMGASDAADDATRRAGLLSGGLDQLSDQQRQMALLDPVMAQAQLQSPGREVTAEQQLATVPALRQQAQQQAAEFSRTRLPQQAEEEAVRPFMSAPGTLGQIIAGATSLGGNVIGGLPSPENAVGGGGGLLRSTASMAGANMLVDPLVQANRVESGQQEAFDPMQTAAAGVLGGVTNVGMRGTGALWRAMRAPSDVQPVQPMPQPSPLALPAPEGIVVDAAGNATRGNGAPWVNEPAMGGGPGMDQWTPRGPAAPMEGIWMPPEAAPGGMPAVVPGAEIRGTDTYAGSPIRPELAAPQGFVVDPAGNAVRGSGAPWGQGDAPLPGGPGMDRQVVPGQRAAPADDGDPRVAEMMARGLSPKGARARAAREQTAKPAEPQAPTAPVTEAPPLNVDDILERAFAPREAPTAPSGKPSLDHLTPEQQRRVEALDHEIETGKVFGDDVSDAQAEYDALVTGKAPESAQAPRSAEPEPPVTPLHAKLTPDMADRLTKELSATHTLQKQGKMTRDSEGKVGRTEFQSSNPDVHDVIKSYGESPDKARNLLARAISGKGRALTERQGNIVSDLVTAMEKRDNPDRWTPEDTPEVPSSQAPVKVDKRTGRPIQDGSLVDRVTKKLDDAKAERDRPRTPDEIQARGAKVLGEGARPLTEMSRDELGQLWYSKDPAEKAAAANEKTRRDWVSAQNYADEQAAALAQLKSAKAKPDEIAAAQKAADTAGRVADRIKGQYDYGKAQAEPAPKAKANPEPAAKANPEPKAEPLELKSQTEAERRASEHATKEANEAKVKARKQAEDKAQADKDANDFVLSGSKSDVDMAEARGQENLFGPGQLNDITKVFTAPVKGLGKWLFGSDADAPTLRENLSEAGRDLKGAFKGKVPPPQGTRGKTIKARGKAVLKAALRPVEKVGYTAEARLRNIGKDLNSPLIEQMVDNYHAQAGKASGIRATEDERMQKAMFGKKPGDDNSRMGTVADIDKALRDMERAAKKAGAPIDRQTVGRKLRNMVENPSLPRTGPLGKMADRVEKLLADLHGYQEKSGITVGKVKNYFPRVLDTGKVENDQAGFMAAARRAYREDNPTLSAAEIDAKAAAYLTRARYGEDTPPGGGHSNAGKADHLKGRELSPAAAKHLESFYDNDPATILSNYVPAAVRRAEQARTGITLADGTRIPFGENFKNWDNIVKALEDENPKMRDRLDEITRLVTSMSGINTQRFSPTVEKWASTARNAVTMSMLEKSANATVTELFTGPMRAVTGRPGKDLTMLAATAGQHGVNLARAMLPKSFGGGRSAKFQSIMDNAEKFGTIHPEGAGSLSAARFAGGDPVGKWNAKMMNNFFRNNLMEPITNAQRATTTYLAQQHLKLVTDGRPGNSVFLGELGIPKADQAEFSRYVQGFGQKGVPDADSIDGKMGDYYRTAVLRFTDQAVQRPTAAVKPRWHSTTIGKFAGQFLAMNTAVYKNIHQRWGRLAMNKDLTRAQKIKMGAAMSANVAAIMGVQGGMLALMDKLFDRADSRELTTGAKAERLLSRMGVFGPLDQPMQAIGSVRYAGSPSQAALGAGPGTAMRLLDSFVGLYGPNNSPNNTNAERKFWRQAMSFAGEPVAQAGLSMLPPGSKALAAATIAGVPKAGQWAVDKYYGPQKPKDKQEPVKGLGESLFSGDKPKKSGGF